MPRTGDGQLPDRCGRINAVDIGAGTARLQNHPPVPVAVAEVKDAVAIVLGEDWADEYGRVVEATLDVVWGPHRWYPSTSCQHAWWEKDPERARQLHGYCQGVVRMDGENKCPARCKHCIARCVCFCHAAEPIGGPVDPSVLLYNPATS